MQDPSAEGFSDAIAALGAPLLDALTAMEQVSRFMGPQTMGKLRREGLGVNAVIVGVVSLPLCIAIVPSLAAMVLGFRAMFHSSGMRYSHAALSGIILGLISFSGGVTYWFTR